jgi:hypothetical protein
MQVQQATGARVFQIDTLNKRVGIGLTGDPTQALDVAGNIQSTGTNTASDFVYSGGGSAQKRYNLSRSLPDSTNNYVEIGNVALTNGSHYVEVSVTTTNASFSTIKQYQLALKYNQTAGAWKDALPMYDGGAVGTNNFALEVNVNNGTATLRLRRTGGAVTSVTANVNVLMLGDTADVFSGTTGTGSSAANSIFSGTPMIFDGVNGRVGIQNAAPAYTLDVTGTINSSSTISAATSVQTPKLITASGDLSVQSATGILSLDKSATDNEIRVFENTGTPTKYISLKYGNISTSNGALTLETGSAAAITIGNGTANAISLGANTTVAATKTLNVTSGLTTLSANAAVSGDALHVSNSTSSGNIAVFSDDSTSVLTIADGGSATIAPVSSNTGTALTITQAGNPTSGNALIVANNTNGTPTGNLFALKTNGNSQLSVDINGNITSNGNLIFASTGNAAGTIRKNMIVSSTVTAGDLVVIDTANAGKVTTTTTADHTKVFGVATTTNGSTNVAQDIVISGIYQVRITPVDGVAGNNVAVGDIITTSTTAGRGKVNNSAPSAAVLGRALSTDDTSSMVWVYITPGAGGAGTNLQLAYDASTNPEITVDSTRGAVTIQDNATAIGANLFEIQQNAGAGSTKYFSVSAANSGTATVNGVLLAPNIDTPTASGILAIGTNNASNIHLNANSYVDSSKSFSAGLSSFSATSNALAAFQVQDSDGIDLISTNTVDKRIAIGAGFARLAVPTGLSVGAATSGGSLTASATYRYKITAVDSVAGETTASTEASGVVGASGTQTLPVTWTASSGASGYKVYRTAANGASNSEVYLTTVVANSFTDTGAIILGSGAPPSTDTSQFISDNFGNLLALSIGGTGTATGQLYVGGALPKVVGSALTNGTLADVATSGRYSYIVDSFNSKFYVYDVSSSVSPTLVSSTSTNMSAPGSVTVQGRYAYVVNLGGSKNLVILDISNPASPVTVSTSTPGTTDPRRIYVQGRYAYITDFSAHKMIVVDISNPASPINVGSISLGGGAASPLGIYVQGRYAYVLDTGAGNTLYVIDISNPSSPTSVGSSTTGLSSPKGIYVQGRYAYVTSSTSGLNIFDVSTPTAVSRVGSINTTLSNPNGVIVQDRIAYVTDATNNSLSTFDVSNPAKPTLSWSAGSLSSAGNLSIQGRYAYVGGGTQFYVIDLGGTYTQQLEAGGAEFGTLSVDNNANFAADASVMGGLTVGQSIEALGNASVNGTLTVQGATTVAGGILGGTTFNSLSAPSAPTVTAGTGSGTASYSYQITAVSSSGGETTPSSASSVGSRPATLSSTNFNTVSWTSVSGAVSYKIYRSSTTNASGNSASTGLLTTVTGLTFNDVGNAASGSLPTVNTSGTVTVNGNALIKSVNNNPSAFQIQNSGGTTILGVDTSTSRIYSTVADGGTAVGFTLNTSNTFSTTGAKLLSVANGGTEQFYVSKDGSVSSNGNISGAGLTSGANLAMTSSSFTTQGNTLKFTTWGAGVVANDVVIYDTSTDTAGRTTTAKDNRVYGVASSTQDYVAVSGATQVTADTGAVSKGDQLVTSTTAGQVKVDNNATTGVIGFATTAKSAGSSGLVGVMIGTVRGDYTPVVQSTGSSSTAFQIQNADSATLFNVDTTGTNAAVNGGAENSTTFATNWAAFGTSTVTRDTTAGEFISGTAGVKAAITAQANAGAQNNLGAALTVSTTYTVSFSAKASTSITDLTVAYYRATATQDVLCSNYNTQTLSTSSWTKVTCSFTTTSTAGASTAFLAIYQAASATRNIFIDNLAISAQNTTGVLNVNQIRIGGTSGQGLTLLTLDTFANYPSTTATINSALYGSMYFDTTQNAMQCYGSAGWANCAPAPNVSVNLIPEYVGLVLNGTGVGTLTSNLCSGTSRLSVNTTLCAATEDYNYYQWTSPQATDQQYNLYVRYQLPATFKNFADINTIRLVARTSSTADGDVKYSMYGPTGTQCGTTTDVTGSGATASTWVTDSHSYLGGDETTCSLQGNDIVTFKIEVHAKNSANVYVSNLSFLTLGK